MIGTFKISIPDKYVISAPDQNGNETNIYFSKLADIYTSNIIKRGGRYGTAMEESTLRLWNLP